MKKVAIASLMCALMLLNGAVLADERDEVEKSDDLIRVIRCADNTIVYNEKDCNMVPQTESIELQNLLDYVKQAYLDAELLGSDVKEKFIESIKNVVNALSDTLGPESNPPTTEPTTSNAQPVAEPTTGNAQPVEQPQNQENPVTQLPRHRVCPNDKAPGLIIGNRCAWLPGNPKPIKRGGRVLVPLRLLSEELGAQVEYEDHTKSINIKTKRGNVKVYIERQKAVLEDGEESSLLVKPEIVNGRTFIGIRDAAHILGKTVEYHADNDEVLVK